MEYHAPAPQHMVLCADCGVPIEPNNANLCVNCLRNSVDITELIPKQATINFCRNCERYLNPPNTWVIAQLESRELLAICLKKLKGLKSVRLIDANFIWTEPHSKRLRVKLTVQKEVFTSTILQQVFEVEFIVQYGQCPDCARLAAKNMWRASVQVRQKVAHKRTFLYLEQLILKYNAHRETVSVLEKKDGLDFYYAQRAHAIRMCEFLASVVPIRTTKSEQLISMDVHTSSSNYKFTYSVEIVPICKDDLLCLPLPLARSLGHIGPFVLPFRVSNVLKLIDPVTMQMADLTAEKYWRDPFPALCTIPEMVEFLVLDIETTGTVAHGPHGQTMQKFLAAEAQVSPLNASTFGESDAVYTVPTHLGHILQPGDTVMGYYLTTANFNSPAWDAVPEERRPDVVLVKKSYPDRKRRSKRNWKLKSIAKEAEDPSAGEQVVGRGALGRRGGLDSQRVERDYELFLRELEEDEEMRANVNLYKDKERIAHEEARRLRREQKYREPTQMDEEMDDHGAGHHDEDGLTDVESEYGSDSELPRVQLDELLDDMDEMAIEDDDI
ncbi:ribosome-binding protein [Malassezia pachydermatis]|uniref:60S ribosomal export protein NMD3 n=1 Tax=Malassezia pachydermatis TaxID=77020 RepID=A0A0M8MWZ6_9BASI|nr:nmd3-domain-containing protein [Malassezia pachydermatis]KOS15211.1 nmd3-domain-containing protein [Malassezia pachydermatis]